MRGWGVPAEGWKKGPWTAEEDKLLNEYVSLHGEGRWSSVARTSGLNRSGKSCRLRWVNYLRPGLKRGQLSPQEEGIIIELHALWGNKWSTIARYLPGRTDNEIKNYWRTHFNKKQKSSQKQEKRKAQMLKHKEQQQQQQQQAEEYDMNMIIPENSTVEQEKQEIVYMYPTTDIEDRWFGFMDQESDSVGDDALWDSLWNLDEVPYGMAMQNQVRTTFGTDGTYKNHYF